MATEVRAPYNVFFGEDGYPLEGGYIFIGVSGLNPLSNPQTAYWDSALTTPAANIRTSGGFPSNNGVIGRLYVPADYSILVQDKHGKTVYSQLEVTFEYSDLLVTEIRGAYTRAARAPATFDLDEILNSGFYAWTNGLTTNQPPACAAGDLFALFVIAGPDSGGFILQTITDITASSLPAYRFSRYSKDGGHTWSAWVHDGCGPFVVTVDANKTFTADELGADTIVLLTSAAPITADIKAGAATGTRVTFVRMGAGDPTLKWSATQSWVLPEGETQDFVWSGSSWKAPPYRSGSVIFGPGAVAATDWIVPPGVSKIYVSGVGQGGDGTSAQSGGNAGGGGGGGSGAYCVRLPEAVVDGTTYTVELKTAGASTLSGDGINLSFGKGSDAAIRTGGAGGIGGGGASNGNAGGTASSTGAGGYGGAGGGGIKSVGSGNTDIHGGNGGDGAFAGTIFSSGGGGAGLSSMGANAPTIGGGGGGAGGDSAAILPGRKGGDGGPGGGGGGGSLGSSFGAKGSGGPPVLIIEW